MTDWVQANSRRDIKDRSGLGAAQFSFADINVRATLTVAQSCPSDSFLVLALASEDYDTDSMHDNVTNNSRVTPQTLGGAVGLITGCVNWQPSVIGERSMSIKQYRGASEANVANAQAAVVLTAGFGTQTTCIAMRVSAFGVSDPEIAHGFELGDYYQLVAFQNSGGPIDINVGHLEFALWKY